MDKSLKMLRTQKFLLFALVLTLMGCTNDSTDDLSAEMLSPETTVTYSQHVKTIIESNCISCHGNIPSAPMSLTTYGEVRDAILNRGLIDRISRSNGQSGLMPQGGTRMPQTNIDIIIKWQADGFPE